MLGQRADSAMVPDHRSALPRVPGIPWWGAVILAATASAVGFAYDAGSGEKTLSAVFSVCYVLGCVLAVLAVRQSGVFSAVIQPPLILFFVVPTAFFVFHGSKITGIKDTLINCGYPLIERFPLMFFTSAIVLLIGMVRWYFGVAARRSASHDSDAPDAATATADSGLAAAAAAAVAAKEKPPERRGRRHSIERPSVVAEELAPSRPARKPRTTTGTERASRSRHARPPETELIEPVAPRPRRPRPAVPPVEPEPRRRTRASQPREPRDAREPRPRRTPPVEPRERSERYDRPQRQDRPDSYERPERRRRPSDYDPYEPRPASGAPRTPRPSDSGSHHPVSRVRYRASDDGEPRTENRTRPPRNRNPETDSWQYDV